MIVTNIIEKKKEESIASYWDDIIVCILCNVELLGN